MGEQKEIGEGIKGNVQRGEGGKYTETRWKGHGRNTKKKKRKVKKRGGRWGKNILKGKNHKKKSKEKTQRPGRVTSTEKKVHKTSKEKTKVKTKGRLCPCQHWVGERKRG